MLSEPPCASALLAVSVVHDIDLLPTDDGVVISASADGVVTIGVPDIEVSLDDIASAIGDADPNTATAHLRAYRWLAARRAIAERSLDELAEIARPVGLPVGHELHPGASWVRQRVLGGCLDLGLGFAGLRRDLPDAVVVVPDQCARGRRHRRQPVVGSGHRIPREHGRAGHHPLAARAARPASADG